MSLVYTDIAMGVRTDTHVDNDGTVIVRRWQDVEDIMKRCKIERSEGNGKSAEILGRELGELPMVVLIAYCDFIGVRWEAVVYGNDHNDVLKRCLKEYQKFQTTDARF